MDNKARYFKSLLTRKTVKYVLGKNQQFALPYRDAADLQNSVAVQFDMKITPSYVDEWNRVFNTGRDLSGIRIPFTYYWPETIKFFIHKLLPGFGMVMKNIFHIGHESEIIDRDFCEPGREMTYQMRTLDLVPWEPNKVVVVTKTEIMDKKSGALVYRAKDYTCCMGIKNEDYEAIRALGLGKEPLPFMSKGFRSRPAKFADQQKDEPRYFLDNMLDHRFGLASGGYTLTHGIKVLANFFRGENPFIQGTCTANMVIMLLTLFKNEELDSYRVYFNNRLYFPGTVSLRSDDHDFELVDEKGTVVAFGSREASAGARSENIA